MLKQSKYNRLLQVSDQIWWLHNISSESECLIDTTEKEMLDNINKTHNDRELISKWEEMGFLVDENVDEDVCLELERKINMYSSIGNQFGIVIAPTMDCNAKCFYCYESDTRQRCYMNSKTEKDLLDYMKSMISGKKKVFVSWFGGEPLLCVDLMKRVSNEIISFCDKLNIEYDAELTTNGYLLGQIVNEFSSLRISDTQVTIDGYEKEYERRKQYINSQNAWEIVVSNIFKYSLLGHHITIRMNFDKKNFESIKNATKFFLTNSKWNENISIYYYPLEPTKGESSNYFIESEYINAMNELYEYLYELGYYNKHPRALEFQKLSLPCYGGTLSTMAVDFAGNIYQCQHLLCHEQYVIGNVVKGIQLNKSVLEWYDGTLPEKCRNCEVIPLCQGGCVTKRKLGQECYLCHMMKYRINIQEKLRIKQLKNCLI